MRARRPLRLVLPLICSSVLLSCNAAHVVGQAAPEGQADAGDASTFPEGDAGAGTCGPFVAGPDLAVCSASYLSGTGIEPGAAVDIGNDGLVLLGGRLEGQDFGAAALPLLGGGSGVVVRLADAGRRVLSVTRLGEAVLDLEVDPKGDEIALAVQPLGVVVLDAKARTVRWRREVYADRVAASGGFVAALGGGNVTLFAADGGIRGTFAVATGASSSALDVALDARSETIVVTGFTSARETFRTPLLSGYGFDGSLKWKSYGWTEEQARAVTHGASSQGMRVAIGRDGKLYYVGQSIGGNTVHLLDPRDLQRAGPIVDTDENSMTYNAGSARVLFVARFSPGDGRIEQGHFLVARDPRDGNAVADTTPTAVAADERGQVLVGGRQACCMRDQKKRAVQGTLVKSSPGDAFVALFAPDFAKRPIWSTWSTGGGATVTGVALRGGRAVVTAVQSDSESEAGPLVTWQPVQASPGGGGSDTFFSVFPVP